jgi:stress response protein YsnF
VITQEQIPAVLGHAVFDSDGNKIGEAKHVFLDDATGMPEWVSVKTGWFGSSESFVPTREAALEGDRLEVPYAKDKVKGAPNVDVDSGGHLSEDEEHRLYDYYGVAWNQAYARANRPGGGWAAAGTGAAAGAAAGTAGTRDGRSGSDMDKDDMGMDTAGAESGTGVSGYRGLSDEADLTADTDLASRPGMVGDMPSGSAVDDDTAYRTGTEEGAARSGLEADGSMTRSEERMRVGVERHEAGRARLRKYVVSEEVEQSVPLRHEEVHVVREPITQADRDATLTGPEITEAEQEVTLYEERPVVETEAVAVERVRLTVEEHTETETVHGRVRKERIDTDGTEMDGTDAIDDDDTFRRPQTP